LELVQEVDDNETVLASLEGTPPAMLTVKERLDGISENTLYSFFWRVTFERDTGTETEIVETHPDVQLGDAESGTLLYDETFAQDTEPDADPMAIDWVSVPSGIHLNISEGEYTGGAIVVPDSL